MKGRSKVQTVVQGWKGSRTEGSFKHGRVAQDGRVVQGWKGRSRIESSFTDERSFEGSMKKNDGRAV